MTIPSDEYERLWREGIDKRFQEQREALEDIRDSLADIKSTAMTAAKFEAFRDEMRISLEAEREQRRELAKEMDKAQTALSVLRWVGGVVAAAVVLIVKLIT